MYNSCFENSWIPYKRFHCSTWKNPKFFAEPKFVKFKTFKINFERNLILFLNFWKQNALIAVIQSPNFWNIILSLLIWNIEFLKKEICWIAILWTLKSNFCKVWCCFIRLALIYDSSFWHQNQFIKQVKCLGARLMNGWNDHFSLSCLCFHQLDKFKCCEAV